MECPLPERRRIQVTYGTQLEAEQAKSAPENSKDASLRRLAALHPFTQQEPPASNVLQDKFSQIKSQYYERPWKLNEFVAFAQPYVQRLSVESDLIALGKPGHLDDDVWCLDTRGLLTLAVCKTTYERLGLVGKVLPWKEHQDTYIVRVSLHAQAPMLKDETCHLYGAKVKAALEVWDQRRGPWDVIFYSPEHATDAAGTTKHILPSIRISQNVHILKLDLSPRPKDANVAEEWDENVAELFEWVGLACLGSERLRAYDRPDPYIAVYTPPSPAYTGDLVHIRWTGLLSPHFVQSVIDVAVETSFACVVANSVTISPVTYLPPPPALRYPRRAPRAQSEDSWSVVVSRGASADDTRWLLVESIGKWDSRWG